MCLYVQGGCMWSVETMVEYLNKFGDGTELWEKIRRQIMHISQLCMHSVQDVVENKGGCFEWFGLDFMVDEKFNVWILECNISPDMSRGTEVLERIVPAALSDLWGMLLTPKKVAESGQGAWDLVFRGKEIKGDVLQKRFCRRKNLMTALRAGRPFAQHDALVCKLGASTNAFLQLNAASRGKGKSKLARRGSKSAKKREEKEEEDEEDEDDDDGEEDGEYCPTSYQEADGQ